jgi:DNA-binding SARP family transcriptional activator
VAGFESAKAQELLCYLLLHPGRPHPRETLAGILWNERPTDVSRKYLRQALWQLQTALCAVIGKKLGDILHVEADWMRLDLNGMFCVDVDALEQSYAHTLGVNGHDLDDQGFARLRAAVHLYKGDLLEGWYQDWCLAARERLQAKYLALLDKLMVACEHRGDYEAGILFGGYILDIDRARETTHHRLMRLHYLAGDRTGALRQFARCRDALRDDLAVDPSRQSIALHEAIRHDRLDALQTEPMRTGQPSEPTTAMLADTLAQLRHLGALLEDIQQHVQRQCGPVEIGLERRTPRSAR